MATSNKNILFTLSNGFAITDNTVYKLRQKKDPSAPEEMQEKGYSKYPGSSDTIKCQFLRDGNVYDTGFEESSRMYVNIQDTKEKTKIVKQRKDNVLKPFLNLKGLDVDRYKPSSLEDWDNFSILLDTNRSFRTNDVKERMELYIALTGYSIVPPNEDEYDYKYDNANFVLESSEIKVKAETSHKLEKTKASAMYYQMMTSNKEGLADILVYIGNTELYKSTGDDTVLLTYLENKILNSTQSTERFLEAYDKFQEEKGAVELKVHRKIVKAIKLKDKEFAKEGGKLIYKNSPIGQTEKEASKYLVENTNMENALEEILFKD